MIRCLSILLVCGSLSLAAAELLPPKPAKHFNDYAGVVPAARAAQFDRQLADFERATSSQIVVAVFPKLNSSSSVEDFTQRTATAWRVGLQDRNNGAVLFVFVQNRVMRIEVGYGLEGVLPDALCKRIIADEITPYFRNQDYAGGLGAGINAMLAATRGEYRGTGRTVAESRRGRSSGIPVPFVLAVIFILLAIFTRGRIVLWLLRAMLTRNRTYSRRGHSWGSGGGSWGGGFSGGGGGFSGGGGSFGGGGASGRW